jgi:hypothetical protein
MSDSGLSDIGLSCFIIGLIRYRTEGLPSDTFFSDIGQGNIYVGYRISATKIFDVAPTYVTIWACKKNIISIGSFRENFHEQETKFRENRDTFRKVFVFAKGQKSVFVPTLHAMQLIINASYIKCF